MVLKVTRGYSPDYLLKEVATGRENYYTGAVAAGEPPGRWWGSGAELLGLRGLVDAQDMRGLYERFLDPRGEVFNHPSRWDEENAERLGHAGRRYLTEEELYNAAVEREPDANAERRAGLRLEAGRNARHNVAFFDLTYNVQKSITLMHTAFEAQQVTAEQADDAEQAEAWGQLRQAVEDAIWAGNNAMLAYLNEQAGYSRIGHHGGAAGRWIDARGWVVASFIQHDSREHDPHLHIHNAFLNRVLGTDGKWRTVDGQLLYRWKRAAAAVAERVTAEHLTRALGVVVAMRPDGKAREVVGIAQQAMDLLSTRRRQVTGKIAELVEAFESRRGRAPTSLELDRLAQQATLLTRRSKSHTGETREQLLDRVDATLRADLDGGLAGIAWTVLDARPDEIKVESWSPRAVIELALEDVRKDKAGWTAADLTAAIEANLPDTLGITGGDDVVQLLRTLTDEGLRYASALDAPQPGDAGLPTEMRLANGDSSYLSPGGHRYATPEQVRTERALVTATAARGAVALPMPVAARYIEVLRESGIELGVDQAAAVRGVLTSGARIECLIGPAGTGKSFVVGALAHAWTDPAHVAGGDSTGPPATAAPAAGRRVFGLATSQVATEVLATEGLTALNVTRWLATQDRLAAGPGAGRPCLVEGDAAWRLHAGDLIVVDESAMTDTTAIEAIHDHVEAAGAKLLLVLDHRQLAAIGAGGTAALLAEAGTRYELTEARRFTHEWERDASLRLREGDESVVDVYHANGRLLDCGTREQAEASAARAWLGDTLAGRESVLLVDDNAAAARLCGQLREELVRLGRVAEHGVPLEQGTIAGVGDLVQARWNGWNLAGVEGNRRGPINRETYQVSAVRDDGALEVRLTAGGANTVGPDGEPIGQRLVLPAGYVAEHLALAYASTVHAAQGRTTDTSHAVITDWTSLAALYVALSRGRDANTAHIATTSTIDDPAQGHPDHVVHRNPRALLAGILADREQLDSIAATRIAADSAARADNVGTIGELLADGAQAATTARTARWLDQLAATGYLTEQQRARMAAEDAAPTLGRVLRRVELAGLDPHQVLVDTITDRPLDGATNLTNVLCSRITDHDTRRYDPHGDTWTQWLPATGQPEWDTYLADLAHAADDRTARLGQALADDPPRWALDSLGPVPGPHDPDRAGWLHRAGTVAGYRELRGHTDSGEALDRPPSPARHPEAYAAYRAAWTALGGPQADQEEHERSTGYHRARVRAWERDRTWEPRYVRNELAGTHQAAEHHRHTAALLHAEAGHVDDVAERARLDREAGQADALAAVLDQTIDTLHAADDVYTRYQLHHATTRGNALISQQIITARGADDDDALVTAEEWLADHTAAVAADDHDRPVTEDDLTDNFDAAEAARRPVPEDEAVAPDLRDVAAGEPRQRGEDDVRVPSPADLAATAARARRTIHEIDAREAWERDAEQHERAAQLNRWHDDDGTTRGDNPDATVADLADGEHDTEPVLATERGV